MRRTTVVLTLTLLLGGSAGLAAQAPDSTAGPDSLRNTADSTGEVKGDGSRRAAREGRRYSLQRPGFSTPILQL